MVTNKLLRQQRKQELINRIKEIGLGNINYTALGQKYGVTHQQIAKDIKIIMREWQSQSINIISSAMETFYEKSMKECHQLANHENPLIRLKAIATGIQAQKDYTEFLENFGRKEKVADKHQVTGAIANINIKDLLEALEKEVP